MDNNAPASAALRRTPQSHAATGGRSALATTLALAIFGAAVHLVFLLTYREMNLSGDEAHYWEWSRRLDISYYSQGPLVAYIIAAGRALLSGTSRAIFGDDTLAVRGPAIALGVLTSLGMHALASRAFRDAWIGTLAVALGATIPIVAVGGLLMTIDAPLVCAWVWCLVFVLRATERRSDEATKRGRQESSAAFWWLGVGLLIAIGLLAKYNMLFAYATVGLLLIVEPALRAWWRRPIVYLAALVGLLGLLPIWLWNASHDWVSFRHVAGQAGVAERLKFDLGAIAAYVGGQAGVIGPIWFAMMLWALWALWKHSHPRPIASTEGAAQNSHSSSAGPRLIVIAAAVPWLIFLAFSPITKIQPNWPAMALPPATIALAWFIRRGWNSAALDTRSWIRRLTVLGAAVGFVSVAIAHRTDLLMPLFKRLASNAPPWDLTPTAKFDPAFRLRGWAELGRAVGEVLTQQRAAGRDPFIISDEYQTASQIAFYTPGNPIVYSAASVLGWRQSQYDIWQNPVRDASEFVGRPCIYVGTLHADHGVVPGAADGPFPGMTLAREVVARVQGEPMQIWTIYTSERFAGFSTGPIKRY